MRLFGVLVALLLLSLSGQAYAGQAPVAVGKNVICAGVAVPQNRYRIQCVVLVAVNSADGSVGLTFQDILRDPVAGTDITTTQSAYVKVGVVFLFAGALPNMPKMRLYNVCGDRATFISTAGPLPPPPPAGSCN